MCDCYTLSPNSEFYQRFGTHNSLPSFPKNIDVVPGLIEPVITHQEGLTLAWVMKWGLIPFWAKERGVGARMFNLKAESVITNSAFKKSFKTQRCLIPANGFYLSSHFVSIDNRPIFSFAGIYDIWVEPVSGHEVYTYAIITVDSNSTLKSISPRMPVILRPDSESTWLDSRTPSLKLESILKASSENLTVSHQ